VTIPFTFAFSIPRSHPPTLTNTQTLWIDLAVFTGRDFASMKTRRELGDKTLLERVIGC
jgi:hypothetical protein